MSAAETDSTRLPPDRWFAVVRDAPLVSIDLIIRDSSGRVLMGWRSNEPARDSWFVPGGAIRKGETLDAAFNRIALTELGLDLQRRDAQLLGVYEHHYATNFAQVPGICTHYVVLAHRIEHDGDIEPADAQHNRLRWFTPEEVLAEPSVHPYSAAYLQGRYPLWAV